MGTDPPILLILGPTAAGKTALAIELAMRLPGGGESISADSMQVYRGMDIGTAKPTAEERSRIPHHLLDIVEPADDGFTVDHWLRLAESTIADVRDRGRWPIVVGGTNLYVKALLEGLFDGPESDSRRRAELEAMSRDELRTMLKGVDSAAAARIHPNDRRRTIRAIEVYEQTGRPISELQQQWDRGEVRDDCLIIGLEYPVEVINRRINTRVKGMIAKGLIEEVRTLHQRSALGRQAREALGYAQIIDALEGRITMDEAIEQIRIRTRRYAKQQRTWLRRFRAVPDSLWIQIEELPDESHISAVLQWIGRGRPDGFNPAS